MLELKVDGDHLTLEWNDTTFLTRIYGIGNGGVSHAMWRDESNPRRGIICLALQPNYVSAINAALAEANPDHFA